MGTGPHWSPGEQGRSADGASPLPGVLVAYLWPESGVSIEHTSCKSSSTGSHLTGKDHAVSSPTPTSPLQYSSMVAVRERDGAVASSFP